jgi:hypothetical protein
VSPEELKKHYKNARRVTGGVITGIGNGRLGEEVRDEIISRNTAKEALVEASKAKTKTECVLSG